MAKTAFIIILSLMLTVPGLPAYAQDDPPLPSGLEEEPTLPFGLEAAEEPPPEEPPLPEGLFPGDSYSGDGEAAEGIRSGLPFELTGFGEMRGGLRTQNDPYEDDASLGEMRLQLEMEKQLAEAALKLTTDFLYDPVLDRHEIRLEEGRGWLDLREANLSITPVAFMDVKAGRQILTWGTGDLVFINDLFPKDWKSFFIGRDPEYLKAPSDAVKASFYNRLANLDIVYTPRFDSDRFIDGRRISYWSGTLGRRAGQDDVLSRDMPRDWFEDDELAWRLFKNAGGYELAVYGYRGFWKSPGGQDSTGKATFPKLSVYGASIRGNVGRGIGNVEAGYYDSEDDRSGDDPLIKNSEIRALAGYEQEIAPEFTAAVQYYLEYMLDYNDYRHTLPAGSRSANEDRHVLTLRLTKLLMSQNLELSLFAFYSPSDKDAYLRPKIHYKINDCWSAEIGGNIFLGEDDHTFFGQFEENSNLYAGIRYNF
jgi:hypothetical protein